MAPKEPEGAVKPWQGLTAHKVCHAGSGVTGRVGDQHVLFGSPRFAAEGLDARQSVLVQRAADHMLNSLGGTVSVFVQSHTALEDSALHPDAGASSSRSSPSSSASGEHSPFSLLPVLVLGQISAVG